MDNPNPHRMHRTTVYLPRDLVDRARLAAGDKNVSIGSLVRAALESSIQRRRPEPEGGFLIAIDMGTQ